MVRKAAGPEPSAGSGRPRAGAGWKTSAVRISETKKTPYNMNRVGATPKGGQLPDRPKERSSRRRKALSSDQEGSKRILEELNETSLRAGTYRQAPTRRKEIDGKWDEIPPKNFGRK